MAALIARFETTDPDDAGARDWSDLDQRMHYIVHLFRCFHEREDLFNAPFTPAQVERLMAGVVPDGRSLRCASKKRRIRPQASSADGWWKPSPRDPHQRVQRPALDRLKNEWPASGYSLTSCSTPARSSAASTFAAAPLSPASRAP